MFAQGSLAWGMLLLASLALADPVATLRAEGCLACHDAGAAAGLGPPLGTLPNVDPVYLREALLTPNATVRDGYPAGLMPAVDPARTERLLPVLAELGATSGAPRGTLPPLIAAALAFCFGHLVFSALPVRERMARRITENGYLSVYSLFILGAFGALIWTWSRAPYVPIWTLGAWARWVPLVVMPFVAIAQIAGYIPGSGPVRDGAPHGIFRITRHPVNISSSVWALAHLFPNGDVASVCLFGSVGLLGVLGSLHIDRRRAARGDPAWPAYAAQTSLVPFWAILRGRTRLDLGEIGALGLGLGLATFVAALLLHTWMMGASPYPILG